MNNDQETTVYPLWGFADSTKIVITRGVDQDQAYRWAEKAWSRGQTISYMMYLPIDAAKCCDENHDAGWLHRAPEWLILEAA